MEPTNAEALDWQSIGDDTVTFRRKRLAAAAGGEALGCSLYELPAGERSWPYHYHTGNEEALFVLEGTGTLRLAGDEHSIESGDYAALPADERGAHRVINDGNDPLRYLAISTMEDPDVTVYPDSDRIGVFAGSPPGSDLPRTVDGYYDREDTVPYWEED
jgi:uncharacterized cupin superfamily protein